MIDHLLAERGYSREQAYALTSVAVNLQISELVDVPNVTVSAFLPLDIFVWNAQRTGFLKHSFTD
jgi:formamidase